MDRTGPQAIFEGLDEILEGLGMDSVEYSEGVLQESGVYVVQADEVWDAWGRELQSS